MYSSSQKKLVFDLAVPYDMALDQQALRCRIEDALSKAGHTYATVIRFDRKA